MNFSSLSCWQSAIGCIFPNSTRAINSTNIQLSYLRRVGLHVSEASTGPSCVGSPHYEDDFIEQAGVGRVAQRAQRYSSVIMMYSVKQTGRGCGQSCC